MSLVYGSSYKRSGSKMAENFVSSRDSITNVNANWMKSSNGFWLSNNSDTELRTSGTEITYLGHAGEIWADEFCFVLWLGLNGAP